MIVSLSSHLFVFFELDRAIFEIIRGHGFQHIELWGMPPHFPIGDIPATKRLGFLLKELGITVQSTHGPFYRSVGHALAGEWLSLCDPDSHRRREAYHMTLLAMEAMKITESRVLVLHSGLPERKRKKDVKFLFENLEKLIRIAEKNGIILALENGPGIPSGVVATTEIVKQFGSSALGICLDLGHSHVEPGMDPLTALRITGPHLVNLHVSDNHGNSDEHNVPGKGTISWEQLISALKDSPSQARRCPLPLLFTYELIDPGRGYPRDFERFGPILEEISRFSQKFLVTEI